MEHQPVILYVEDDPSSRTVMEILLGHMGYEHLTIFQDSTDFMGRLDALPQKPDIFLLDIRSYPYDGFVLLELLREHRDYQDAIVIAVTAGIMRSEILGLKLAGFNGVIAKPMRQTDFPHLIQHILNRKEIWYS